MRIRHFLLRRARPERPGVGPGTHQTAGAEVQMTRTAEYYDNASYTHDPAQRGTGVVGLLSGDQLHPPMVDDVNVWKSLDGWKRGAREHVRRLTRHIQREDLVLDIGCGIGGATRLAGWEQQCRVVGLNISERQIRTACALGNESYVVANGERLPVRTAAVDCVLCVNMFYHVQQKSAFLAETSRVLAEGGILLFDDWTITKSTTREDQLRLNNHWNPEPVPWLTDEELITQIQTAGFELREMHDYAHVGRGVMAEHFAPTFEREARPLIEREDAVYGKTVADHFFEAITHTIDMYRNHKMAYLQIVAVKR